MMAGLRDDYPANAGVRKWRVKDREKLRNTTDKAKAHPKPLSLLLVMIILIVMFMYSHCYVCSVLYILFSSCQLALFNYPDRFFRAFSSVVRQMPGYNSQRRGTARTLPKLIVLFCVLLCVNVDCTAATGCQPNCSLYIYIYIYIYIYTHTHTHTHTHTYIYHIIITKTVQIKV